MNKNIIAKVIFILLFILIIFSQINITYCSTIDNIISGGEDFIKNGESQTTPINSTSLKALSDNLYNILLFIGLAVAIIVGLVLGIQFMTGSVEQKAKVKDSLIAYVAGCVVVFGAFGIWKLVVTILQVI